MAERKTMGEAMEDLPDKALDFIRPGRAEPQKVLKTVEKAVELPRRQNDEKDTAEGEALSADEAKTPKRRKRTSFGGVRSAAESQDVRDILVSQSFRLRYSSVEALNDAWLDRKRLHRKAKLQDIAQEAVDDWLKRHDYID
jgi:hypothetical protein